jgi:hypothetical protein
MKWYITPMRYQWTMTERSVIPSKRINTFVSAYSLGGLDTIRPKVHGFKPSWGWWIFKGDRSLKHNFLHKGRKARGGSNAINLRNVKKKKTFAHNKRWAKVKFRCHFRSPTKLPTLLLDATGVIQLQRPLANKSGNNLISPNRAELHWITG